MPPFCYLCFPQTTNTVQGKRKCADCGLYYLGCKSHPRIKVNGALAFYCPHKYPDLEFWKNNIHPKKAGIAAKKKWESTNRGKCFYCHELGFPDVKIPTSDHLPPTDPDLSLFIHKNYRVILSARNNHCYADTDAKGVYYCPNHFDKQTREEWLNDVKQHNFVARQLAKTKNMCPGCRQSRSHSSHLRHPSHPQDETVFYCPIRDASEFASFQDWCSSKKISKDFITRSGNLERNSRLILVLWTKGEEGKQSGVCEVFVGP